MRVLGFDLGFTTDNIAAGVSLDVRSASDVDLLDVFLFEPSKLDMKLPWHARIAAMAALVHQAVLLAQPELVAWEEPYTRGHVQPQTAVHLAHLAGVLLASASLVRAKTMPVQPGQAKSAVGAASVAKVPKEQRREAGKDAVIAAVIERLHEGSQLDWLREPGAAHRTHVADAYAVAYAGGLLHLGLLTARTKRKKATTARTAVRKAA